MNDETKVIKIICYMCGVEFLSTFTEEEAMQEARNDGFGKIPKEACVTVCNPCYIKAMKVYSKTN